MSTSTKFQILLVTLFLTVTSHSNAAILTPDLQLWLKADSIQGVSNGGGISTWNDSSSYGRNASAYRGAPILQTTALNGQQVVSFNGYNSFAVPDSSVWDLNNFTIYSVVSVNPKARGDDWWSGIWLAHDQGCCQPLKWFADIGYNGSSLATVGFDPVGSFSNPLPASTFGIIEFQKQGSSFSAWLNGSLLGTAAAGSVPNASAPLTIGFAECVYDPNCLADSGFKGKIGELMIYNTAIDNSQSQEVGLYLSNKYGIASSYVVPEPASITLLIVGLSLVGAFHKKAV